MAPSSEVGSASERTVLLVSHTGRAEAVRVAREAARRLLAAGLRVRVLAGEAEQLAVTDAEVVEASDTAAAGCELVMVFGGDGTILRGAEVALGTGTPVLGVNLGHIGFLAEAERDDLAVTVEHLVAREYQVEERMSIEVVVTQDGGEIARGWAVNEVTVEKAARERMIEVVVEVDGRPLSRWGCDGVVAATPTGSTAYAFSAGGPIVWPQVEAMLLVPLSAHALFARPLVVGPSSQLAIELVPPHVGSGVLWCDGRRTLELPHGARIEVRRGPRPVRLARLHRSPFTDRLVRKFDLPTQGWRGRRARELGEPERSAGPDRSGGGDRSELDR